MLSVPLPACLPAAEGPGKNSEALEDGSGRSLGAWEELGQELHAGL